MSELITNSISTKAGEATVIEVNPDPLDWDRATLIDLNVISVVTTDINTIDAVTTVSHAVSRKIDEQVGLPIAGDFDIIQATTVAFNLGAGARDIWVEVCTPNDFNWIDAPTEEPYVCVLPYLDSTRSLPWHSVHVFGEKFNRIPDPLYDSNSDFNIGSELMGFTGDFVKPIDYSNLKTPASPVGNQGSLPWSRPYVIDIDKSLTYGYSVNNFLVNGSVDGRYDIDEDALPIPPPPPPEPIEVISFVNVINIVTLPERTPIDFDNLTLATDLDSVAWVVNFDVINQATVASIKPQGLTVKYVEIDINGDKFEVFIGRTSTSVGADSTTRKTVRRTKCTGWSAVKQLTYPYSPKRSHTETTVETPAGILARELTGTGFTGVWGSPSWSLPAGVFSYLEKAPLAAISELAQSVGGVIVPDDIGKGFSVQPRYPVSPWDWSITTPDLNLHELNFFTMDTEWVPAESPDSIYVYGEEKGVGVKCVKSGEAGTKTLPTIVDKHITDTIAGTERGRIEVAKNGFKEIIPITTYVDNGGVTKPRTLVKVTAADDSEWFGMVTGVQVSLKRNGNALVQSLQIERHYE